MIENTREQMTDNQAAAIQGCKTPFLSAAQPEAWDSAFSKHMVSAEEIHVRNCFVMKVE